MEAEVQKDEPLRLGREATDSLVRFEKTRIDFRHNELATFLFRTREGGRGIVQVFPKDQDADRFRLRYRMWLIEQNNPAASPPVAKPVAGPRGRRSPETPFGRIATTTLELPADGREWFLDLKTGRKAIPPEFVNPNEIASTQMLPRNKQFTKWRGEHGIGVFGHLTPAGPDQVAPAGAEPTKSESQLSLIGLDMIEARIEPLTFDELTVEESREILERKPENNSSISWMMIDSQLTEKPDTFAFKTREGRVGLLQFKAPGKKPGKLTIRYHSSPGTDW